MQATMERSPAPLTVTCLSGVNSYSRDAVGVQDVDREPAAATTVKDSRLGIAWPGRAAESPHQRNDEAFHARGDSGCLLLQQFLLAWVVRIPIEILEFGAAQEID